MNKYNKRAKQFKAGTIVAGMVAPLVEPAVSIAVNYITKAAEERKKLVSVPLLCSKDFPLTIEQAVEIITECGLKAMIFKTSIGDADAIYRNCFDTQVIQSNPKAKQKVKPGSKVYVKYITQETIDESRRIFDAEEKEKVQAAIDRTVRRSERKEKTQRAISGAIDTTRNVVEKVPDIFRKKKHIEVK